MRTVLIKSFLMYEISDGLSKADATAFVLFSSGGSE